MQVAALRFRIEFVADDYYFRKGRRNVLIKFWRMVKLDHKVGYEGLLRPDDEKCILTLL
jgi:hypothetical protein